MITNKGMKPILLFCGIAVITGSLIWSIFGQDGQPPLEGHETTQVKLEWDASPSAVDTPIQYKVYRNGQFLELVNGLEYTAEVVGKTSFYVTAYDVEGGGESEPSNEVTWYPQPKPPGNLRLSVNLSLSVPLPEDDEEMNRIINKVKEALKEEQNQ